MAAERKISEGMDRIEKAEKYLKTSLFKWKPDFDSAADEFNKAGTCFKNARSYDQAKMAYMRAGQALQNNKALFHAAKAYENAAMMLKEMKNLDGAAELMEKAAGMYREHGTPDTAALTLEKAAKMIETVKPARAVELYEHACEVVELEDRPRQAVNSLSQAAKLLVRMKEFDRAVSVLKRERTMYEEMENFPSVNRNLVYTGLVHIHRGDYVAADQVLQHGMRYPGFSDSDMYFGLSQLLTAYDEQDQDRVNSIVSTPLFTYMDNDYAKLAKSIRVPGGGGGGKKTASLDPGADDTRHQEEEEDEYAGGLC
ncbi:gamma-soluble NSF attachment protein-like isoform X2 [Ptychodera flava]|uniref:gamma-soluble NSF attachment protein-like isoform X2 n=1 Tax=Ptychodera flava TaxID=63121 RepID=UPI003969EA36